MKTLYFLIFITAGFFISKSVDAQNYLFYIHGRIVEIQGENAVDTQNGYGSYEYNKIINTFKKNGFRVISEVRPADTRVLPYAKKVAHQIDSLIFMGVSAGKITVVGASKGSLIAMITSSLLKNRNINFVFLAACNSYSFKRYPKLKFYGNILSIYEKSDRIGRSCDSFKARSMTTINHYKEIALNTGKKHGFLFKPLPQWIYPAIQWGKQNYNFVIKNN